MSDLTSLKKRHLERLFEIDAEALTASAEPELEAVAREVRDAINKNKPEVGLDPLHTFTGVD